jgi:hypothetical protein
VLKDLGIPLVRELEVPLNIYRWWYTIEMPSWPPHSLCLPWGTWMPVCPGAVVRKKQNQSDSPCSCWILSGWPSNELICVVLSRNSTYGNHLRKSLFFQHNQGKDTGLSLSRGAGPSSP